MADSTHLGLSSDWNAAVDGDSLTNSANHAMRFDGPHKPSLFYSAFF